MNSLSRQSDTLVAIATYNEIENLPGLLEKIFSALPKAHVLVVDDDSPDGTGSWCDQYAENDPRLKCLHRQGKLGLGTAVIDAMKYAIEHKYSFLLNMDADYSHDPQVLPDLLAAVQNETINADVAVGSRYIRGGKILGWPVKRHLMSRCINLFTRVMLSLPLKDCSGSFRCYRVSLFKDLDFERIVSRGYSFFEEILWRLKRIDANFHEIPITFTERVKGASKINMKEAWKAVGIIFRLGITNWLGL